MLLQQLPQLKQMVRPAIEKAVQDLLAPVVERSIKIALTTAENIVKKVYSSTRQCKITIGYYWLTFDPFWFDKFTVHFLWSD